MFAVDVPAILNDLLPRSPPITIALLFQGLDQVSPDLCCPRITLPCSDWLTSVAVQLDRMLPQGRAVRFCMLSQTLGDDSLYLS